MHFPNDKYNKFIKLLSFAVAYVAFAPIETMLRVAVLNAFASVADGNG